MSRPKFNFGDKVIYHGRYRQEGDSTREYTITHQGVEIGTRRGYIYHLQRKSGSTNSMITCVPEEDITLASNYKPKDMSKPKFDIDDAVRVERYPGVFFVTSRTRSVKGWPPEEWVYTLTSNREYNDVTAVESALTKATLFDAIANNFKNRKTMSITTLLRFSEALEALKNGQYISRKGWNGKGMWLFLNKGSYDSLSFVGKTYEIEGVDIKLFDKGDKGTVTRLPNINMRNANGSIVTGWFASQTDLLADDWIVMRDTVTEEKPTTDPIFSKGSFVYVMDPEYRGSWKVNSDPYRIQGTEQWWYQLVSPDIPVDRSPVLVISEDKVFHVTPVPNNIRFCRIRNGNLTETIYLVSPNGKMMLGSFMGLPSAAIRYVPTRKHNAYLLPVDRASLKSGDIAFRGIPNIPQDTSIYHQYCVILNRYESAYWVNEMDMKVDGNEDAVAWYKVIFE